jgi:hypothetical protein
MPVLIHFASTPPRALPFFAILWIAIFIDFFALCRARSVAEAAPPIATGKAHRAGQFCRERFYLLLDLGCAVDSTELLGLIQFLAKFCKPYPIGGFGLFIQNFPRIAQRPR